MNRLHKLRYFISFLTITFAALFVPAQTHAAFSINYDNNTGILDFISTEASDCDSSTDDYYLQTYIFTAPPPWYADPNSGMPIPADAWWSYYGGGSFVAPYTDSLNVRTMGDLGWPTLPYGTYWAAIVCIITQTNPDNYHEYAGAIQEFTYGPVVTPTPTPSSTTLTPVADTFIKSGSQNENEGSSTLMRLQSSGHNRGLVKFNQSEILQAVGTSQNYTAALKLTISDNGDNWGTGREIGVHRLLQDWVEGNGYIVGNNPTFRGTGSGTTWNCATDTNIANQNDDCSGNTSWNMTNSSLWPFISSPTATTTITNGQSGIVTFNVTSDVQNFVNGTNTNVGWVIKKSNEGQNGRVEFGTKESLFSPQLIITNQ